MNTIKANLFLIVLGVVVVLGGGILWWWSSDKQVVLQQAMEDRAKQEKTIRSAYLKVPIEIPGGGMKFQGAVADNVIKVREVIQKHTKEQVTLISETAAKENEKNRVQHQGGKVVPLIYDPEIGKMVSLDNFLPTMARSTDGHAFNRIYSRMVPSLLLRLVGSSSPAVAPTTNEITLAFEADKAARLSKAPLDLKGGVLQPPTGLSDPKILQDFTKKFVSNRAANIKMYVHENAFVIEPWMDKGIEPTEAQIFETFVHQWIQEDVVRSIMHVNEKSKNVGESAVKRLDKISIGGEGGALFVAGARAADASGIDFSKSMTGRTGSGEYDVVMLNISMIIDPSKLNAFCEALYVQNNGYTVLNIKQQSVDPYLAASEGYLLGVNQCVSVQMQIECLMFRKWTDKLMPAEFRRSLGPDTARPR